MKSMHFRLFAAAVTLVSTGTLDAQVDRGSSGAAGGLYFSESSAHVDGGSAQSTTYKMAATIGAPILAGRANSTNFGVEGSFLGTLSASGSHPWVTSCLPNFVTPLSQLTVWLSGTRLDIGGTPIVTVGGKTATILSRSPTALAVRLPSLSVPGFQPIVVQNTSGSSTLPRGVGVLPMIFTEGAPASNKGFDLIFKGTQTDTIIWALGVNEGPPIPISNFLHGLTINASFVRILPTMQITSPTGELRLPIPAVPFNFKIYVQGLFVSTNPGYAPGSFSNLISF